MTEPQPQSTPAPSPTPKMSRRRALALLGMAGVVAYVAPTLTPLGSAQASGGMIRFNIADPVTAKECGDCHMAYGAETLPQGSWRRIMNDLPNHFGEDASLDESTRKHIEGYLVANSNAGEGPLRISETRWFVSAHRGEVSASALTKAGSWANCTSCH